MVQLSHGYLLKSIKLLQAVLKYMKWIEFTLIYNVIFKASIKSLCSDENIKKCAKKMKKILWFLCRDRTYDKSYYKDMVSFLKIIM